MTWLPLSAVSGKVQPQIRAGEPDVRAALKAVDQLVTLVEVLWFDYGHW